MTMISKTVAERTRPGQRQSVEEQGMAWILTLVYVRATELTSSNHLDYVVHCYARSEGVAGVVITKDYPHIAAHSVLSKLMDQFLAEKPLASIQGKKDGEVPFPPLKEYITKYQDSNEASSIAKIQQELDETKIILHKAIDSVRSAFLELIPEYRILTGV